MKKIHYWLDSLPTQKTLYSVQIMTNSVGYVTRFTDVEKAQDLLAKFSDQKCEFKTLPQTLATALKIVKNDASS